MDASTNHDASSPSPSASVSVHSGGPESEFNKSSISRRTSGGDSLRESESTGEIITNFELDIACICEKLANLNLLSMHVETRESDFEAFFPDMDPDLSDLGVKALEFDFLSGFLDSEVKVLETYISDLQIDKANLRELLSSRKHLAESLMGMEDMLHDSEKSLEQSLEQVLEIKVRAADFQRNFLRLAGEETYKDHVESSKDGELELKEKMKMQTVEHQRHVLRMLEKSLEREIELEKKLSESVQMEEALTTRLHSSEREVLFTEMEAENTLEKMYQTHHTSELLMEISKELLSTIKMLQFNLRGSVQREAEMKTVMLEFEKRFKESDEKVVLLEKELSETQARLQNMEACYEASQEEESMLKSTIKDMGNVIGDLKKKVSEAEIQTESVEDKCVFLSESNAELKKELGFVRGRVKCLEASLHRTEEIKKATANDISVRSKLITDLVMQMALERERLQKQISSLKQENKILVKRLKKTDKYPAVKVSHDGKAGGADRGLSKNDFRENKESLSTSFEARDTVMGPTDSTSEFQTMRNIDARELELKYILLVLFVLIIPLFGVLFHQAQVQ